MGEQRPLETLRSFVEAVWGGKPRPTREHATDDDIWLVPDHRAGLTELARITTRANAAGVGTDFYELYWSDLLVGNTMAQIRGWVFGLLWRWPHQVPRETFALWVVLWVLVAAVAALAAFVGLTFSWDGLAMLWEQAGTVQNELTCWLSFGVTVLLWIYFGWRLWRNLEHWTDANAVFPGIWTLKPPSAVTVHRAVSALLAFVLPVLVGYAAYKWFPWPVLQELNTWLIIAGLFVGYLLTAFVVPVFGDVARYVRVSPDAVTARAHIRERGVDLLRTLHGPAGPGGKRYDFGSERGYERIVVVGHSLGSIIAYDVLRLFWQEYGPTGRNPVTGEALDALRELDEFCRKAQSSGGEFDIETFRRLQGAVSEAMREEPGKWRITDFVTLGSPLTHAEFLVSRDRVAFEERKAERMFPTCPPMMEPDRKSFLYPDRPGSFAHHAAMFAAMRWTNIHDPHPLPFLGDFISGPCRPNFGPGVVDVPVEIRGRFLRWRFVTHTLYWDARASGYATREVGRRLRIDDVSKDSKAHVTLLRKALALR